MALLQLRAALYSRTFLLPV